MVCVKGVWIQKEKKSAMIKKTIWQLEKCHAFDMSCCYSFHFFVVKLTWYGRFATQTSKNGRSVFRTSPTITLSLLACGLKTNKLDINISLVNKGNSRNNNKNVSGCCIYTLIICFLVGWPLGHPRGTPSNVQGMVRFWNSFLSLRGRGIVQFWKWIH